MRLPRWSTVLVLALAVAGITAVYRGPLATRFLNDDYLFLEQARSQPFLASLTRPDPLGNYYRPISRQAYFEALTPISGGSPRVFHLVNYTLFLLALALLVDLLRARLPAPGVVAGALYFALLPFQRVNLTWVSCSQDLLALVGVLGAIALWRRGRRGLALLPGAAAFASKESALPLPLGLVAWELWPAAGTEVALPLVSRLKPALRRTWPVFALALSWVALSSAMRARNVVAAPLDFGLSSFFAGYAHLVQALVGLEDPANWISALLAHGPSLVALALIAPLAVWAGLAVRGRAAEPMEDATRVGSVTPRAVAAFGIAWLVAFGVVAGPVAASWSAYYYTLAAVGGAVLVGLLLRRAHALALLVLLAVSLWVHAGTNAIQSFSISRSAWDWTSHLTSFYFDRGAALTDSMSRQLVRLDPQPPADARMFFSNLPAYAGFQMGNGALIRALYRAPGIASHFYTQYSDSTAGDHPALFYYWDGARLLPLYRRARAPMFHVGTDLLLLDRLDGAAHALRRGLAQGEDAKDHLYWLGWIELWRGRRDHAEELWTRYGAHDDSVRWVAHMDEAYRLLVERDTLEARRHLITAITYGMGRPEGHGILGALLVGQHPKYGLLELEVANRLNPSDPGVRRERVLGLERIGYTDRAREELAVLKRQVPEWRVDPALVAADVRLGGPDASRVVRFER